MDSISQGQTRAEGSQVQDVEESELMEGVIEIINTIRESTSEENREVAIAALGW